ncbi:cupin domain-containing protein [Muriicola sp.]|uniref:cupin domain-containing protein n=1 Tax=Muriicola sp. TaxID=2020856 RepID=UPI0035639C26
MNQSELFWVLGHEIRLQDITGDYDLISGTTPAQTQGPPPHTHQRYHEVFIVTEGEMEFVIDGRPTTARKGDVINLPPDTIHTFANKTHQPCQWINIHSPKGFLQFFREFGISSAENNAQMRSVSPELIQGVMKNAKKYDMHIQ